MKNRTRKRKILGQHQGKSLLCIGPTMSTIMTKGRSREDNSKRSVVARPQGEEEVRGVEQKHLEKRANGKIVDVLFSEYNIYPSICKVIT